MGGEGFARDEGQNILKNLLSISKATISVIFSHILFFPPTCNWLFLEVCSLTYEFKLFLTVNYYQLRRIFSVSHIQKATVLILSTLQRLQVIERHLPNNFI